MNCDAMNSSKLVLHLYIGRHHSCYHLHLLGPSFKLAYGSCLHYVDGCPTDPQTASQVTLGLPYHQGLVQQSLGSWLALIPVPSWAWSPILDTRGLP